jgi:adenine-specific DNA-methyltransferase
MMTFSEIEIQRQAEQKRLDDMKDAKDRNRTGQFATPPDLAIEIMRYVKNLWTPNQHICFLEPSIGTGAFYSALKSVFTESPIKDAIGVEIDQQIADVTHQLWGETGLHVIKDDFTQLAPEKTQRFNLLVANPPYVRHHHLTANQKVDLQNRVQNQIGYRVNGLAGLYSYFVLLADQWLVEDGLAIWLIPSEFMDVNYGEALRQYLTERVTLLRIHRAQPDDLQFEQALVSSAIVVYRKTAPASDHQVKFSVGGSIESPDHNENIALDQLRHHRKWTRVSGIGLDKKSHRNSTTLCMSDLFDIKRGIATGANEFFILKREEAAKRKLPSVFLRPILPSPRYLTESVIYAEENGFPNLSDQYVLLDCSLPIEQIRTQYSALYEYLIEGQLKGLDTRYLAKTRKPWYRQEQRAVAPFLCTYMGRNLQTRHPFRFFWNQSQALAPNVYLMLYPKESLAVALRESASLQNEIFTQLQTIDFGLFQDEGRVYGGALHKIEPKELGRVLLPDFRTTIYSKQIPLF